MFFDPARHEPLQAIPWDEDRVRGLHQPDRCRDRGPVHPRGLVAAPPA